MRKRTRGGASLSGGSLGARPPRRARARAPVELRRVVRLPEPAQDVDERDLGGVVDDLHGLGVPRAPGAHLVVRRVGRVARGVSDGGRDDPAGGRQPPHALLGSPEAAVGEDDLLGAGREGLAHRRLEHEVQRRDRHRRRAAGQRLILGDHLRGACAGPGPRGSGRAQRRDARQARKRRCRMWWARASARARAQPRRPSARCRIRGARAPMSTMLRTSLPSMRGPPDAARGTARRPEGRRWRRAAVNDLRSAGLRPRAAARRSLAYQRLRPEISRLRVS